MCVCVCVCFQKPCPTSPAGCGDKFSPQWFLIIRETLLLCHAQTCDCGVGQSGKCACSEIVSKCCFGHIKALVKLSSLALVPRLLMLFVGPGLGFMGARIGIHCPELCIHVGIVSE